MDVVHRAQLSWQGVHFVDQLSMGQSVHRLHCDEVSSGSLSQLIDIDDVWVTEESPQASFDLGSVRVVVWGFSSKIDIETPG
jgi:hypothetical protein